MVNTPERYSQQLETPSSAPPRWLALPCTTQVPPCLVSRPSRTPPRSRLASSPLEPISNNRKHDRSPQLRMALKNLLGKFGWCRIKRVCLGRYVDTVVFGLVIRCRRAKEVNPVPSEWSEPSIHYKLPRLLLRVLCTPPRCKVGLISSRQPGSTPQASNAFLVAAQDQGEGKRLMRLLGALVLRGCGTHTSLSNRAATGSPVRSSPPSRAPLSPLFLVVVTSHLPSVSCVGL